MLSIEWRRVFKEWRNDSAMEERQIALAKDVTQVSAVLSKLSTESKQLVQLNASQTQRVVEQSASIQNLQKLVKEDVVASANAIKQQKRKVESGDVFAFVLEEAYKVEADAVDEKKLNEYQTDLLKIARTAWTSESFEISTPDWVATKAIFFAHAKKRYTGAVSLDVMFDNFL